MTASRQTAVLAAPLLVLGLGLAVLLFDPLGAVTALRGALFDAYQTHAAMPPVSAPPIRILRIDSASIARNGAWPWNQARLAALAGAVRDGGAAMLVFPAPLSGTDTSPQNLAAALPPDAGFNAARAALSAIPAPADNLAAVFKTVPTVLGLALGGDGGVPARAKARFEYRGGADPFGAAPGFATAIAPIPVLTAAAAGLGANNLAVAPDGVLRRMPAVFHLGNGLVPSLAVEIARLSSHAPKLVFEGRSNLLGTELAAFDIGGHTIATDADGRFWLDYAHAPTAPLVTASALLAGTASPLALKDAIVIVDPPDTAIRTPRGSESAAAVLAQGFSNLIAGDVLARPFFALPAEFAFLFLTGTIVMALLLRWRIYWAGLFVAVSIAGALYASWFLFAARHWLLDGATPTLALFLCFTAGALARLGELRRARVDLRLAFADSLPRASIEKIAHYPSLLTIEGETRNVTYLVCGVRGLTGLAARFGDDPKGFTQLLQRIFSPLLDQVLAHGGTIDRLTADGFAAFWNAPLADPDHALHACEAANGMSIMAARVTENLAQEPAMRARKVPPLEIGVGIATGNAIAGGFGGHGRLGYSVNGEVPTLARRLQALSGQYGPAVIVAEETQKAAGRGFTFLEVDMIAASALDHPVRLYAMLGSPAVRSSPKFRALITFHDHIFQSLHAQQWAKARAMIEQCRRLSGASQRLYDLHLARIRYFEANPPGADWDGAFRPILK